MSDRDEFGLNPIPSERDLEDIRKHQERRGEVREPMDLTDALNAALESADGPVEPSEPETPADIPEKAPIIAPEKGSEQWTHELDMAMDGVVASLEALWRAVERGETDPELTDSLRDMNQEIKGLMVEAVIPYSDQINTLVSNVLEYTHMEAAEDGQGDGETEDDPTGS